MASYATARAAHAALSASTVDDVTITSTTAQFAVINRGTDDVTYVFGTAPGDPEELADDTFVVPGGGVAVHDWLPGVPLVVKLISAGTPGYSVQAV